MVDFTKLRIGLIATNGFEEYELTEPFRAVRQAGAQVEVLAPASAREAGPSPGRIQGYHHLEKTISVPVDHYLDQILARPKIYHGVILPGGALSADQLRAEKQVIQFIQEIQQTEKLLAFIGHAAWILISAGLVRGRTLTSYHSLQDDVRNAGGNWVDLPVIVDNNWVSSRKTSDILNFNRDVIETLSRATPLMSEEVRRAAARARFA